MADAYTKLLLHCNGADESTDIPDSSDSDHEITCHGTAELDTAQKWQGTASVLLDGDSDFLTAPNHVDWDFGAGDWTLDIRGRFNALPALDTGVSLFFRWPDTADKSWLVVILNDGGVYKIRFRCSTDGTTEATAIQSDALTLAVDTFYHFAIVRDGNTLRFFHDGVAKGTGDLTGLTLFDSSTEITIGAHSVHTTKFFNGWLDEIRVSKGIARWTEAFTPPTVEYGDLTVEVSTLALALALQAPSLAFDYTVTPPTLALALTQHAPTAYPIITVTPDTLALALTLQTPTTHSSVTVTPATLELALTQHAPSLAFDYTVTPPTLALELTQHAPIIVIPSDVTVFPVTLNLALTQHAPIITMRVTEIPPFMQQDLIDPYSGGAWLWLVEVAVPGYDVVRIARNTVAVIYSGALFGKGNFNVGRQALTGDGSVPKIQLQVAQDRGHNLEAIVNATKGGEGGQVKIIRTCEKFLEHAVGQLEAEYDVLTAGSDIQWVTFVLGIPSPLTQRIPLWLYSSKVCPLATPSLFKGPKCQYVGLDTVCTGLLEDCYAKGNAVHWGAEAGLDPNAVRI